MQLPEDSLPKLDPKDVKKKQRAIEQFFIDNWGNDFENVSFLVAQNGQIIFEKYEGFEGKLRDFLPNFESKLYQSKHEIIQPMRGDIKTWLAARSAE